MELTGHEIAARLAMTVYADRVGPYSMIMLGPDRTSPFYGYPQTTRRPCRCFRNGAGNTPL
jgi:hypothetical protein